MANERLITTTARQMIGIYKAADLNLKPPLFCYISATAAIVQHLLFQHPVDLQSAADPHMLLQNAAASLSTTAAFFQTL